MELIQKLINDCDYYITCICSFIGRKLSAQMPGVKSSPKRDPITSLKFFQNILFLVTNNMIPQPDVLNDNCLIGIVSCDRKVHSSVFF